MWFLLAKIAASVGVVVLGVAAGVQLERLRVQTPEENVTRETMINAGVALVAAIAAMVGVWLL